MWWVWLQACGRKSHVYVSRDMSPREGPSVLACDGPCGRGPPAIPPPGTPPRPPALSSPHVLWWTHLSAHLLSQPFPARSHVKSNVAHLGGRGRSSRYTMGSGMCLRAPHKMCRGCYRGHHPYKGDSVPHKS